MSDSETLIEVMTNRDANSPIFASRDAGRVKSLADEIYAWAKTLVHNSAKDTATISKQAKLKKKMMMTETTCSRSSCDQNDHRKCEPASMRLTSACR